MSITYSQILSHMDVYFYMLVIYIHSRPSPFFSLTLCLFKLMAFGGTKVRRTCCSCLFCLIVHFVLATLPLWQGIWKTWQHFLKPSVRAGSLPKVAGLWWKGRAIRQVRCLIRSNSKMLWFIIKPEKYWEVTINYSQVLLDSVTLTWDESNGFLLQML